MIKKMLLVLLLNIIITAINPLCCAGFCICHLQQSHIGQLHIHFIIHFNANHIMFFSGNTQCIFKFIIKEITQYKNNSSSGGLCC